MTKVHTPTSIAHNYVINMAFQGDDIWVATAVGLSHGMRESLKEGESTEQARAIVDNAVLAGEIRRTIRKKAIAAKEVLNEAFAYSKPSSFSRGLRVENNGVVTLLDFRYREHRRTRSIGSHRRLPRAARRTYDNITGLLEAEGATWKDIVRTTCYLRDIERDYEAFNEERTKFFRRAGSRPAARLHGHSGDPVPSGTADRDRSDRHVPDGSQGLEARERARAYPVWSWLSPFHGCARKRKGSMSIAGNVGLKDLPRICPLISRRVQSCLDAGETRIVSVGEVQFGGARPVVIAGPCAVESREQTLEVARAVKIAGAEMLRGGAFKPRTSPHDFCGPRPGRPENPARSEPRNGSADRNRSDGPAARRNRCGICGHAADRFAQYAELSAARRSGKMRQARPVKARNGGQLVRVAGRRAEYVAKEGNLEIVLCERGIKAYPSGEYSRNVLDLSVIPAVKEETFLP